ncbi:helix-turn-helix domain-containing protein [Candidatus Methylobacter oryzae]|uniref:XRE family transcriptional regulator n=1 Tax=Candidatus Methylobacter oryzae TaxID=2497749 RepID=A0ABY3CCE6_9GAMM|nr:XRE family transcriptional regulator [Candidatus Methylobacter oryzae]TRW98987.1 XRE family transcriptional regulator [Candidatus Methylobacter oryzae]
MESPTPEEIIDARKKSSKSQTEAAAVIYCSLGAWQKWELGKRTMHPAFFELFKIKTIANGRN